MAGFWPLYEDYLPQAVILARQELPRFLLKHWTRQLQFLEQLLQGMRIKAGKILSN